MKSILSLIACLAAAATSAQTRMTILSSGRQLGYATVSRRIEADGSKQVELRLQIGTPPRTIRISSESRYDSQGKPVRMFRETAVEGRLERNSVVATFDAAGATAVTLDGDTRKVKKATLAATAPRICLSEFWFVRDRPSPGTKEDAYQFNLETFEWELATTEFVGDKKITVAGRTVTAHEIRTRRGSKDVVSYLDDEGMPVLIVQESTRLEKIWPK